MMRKSPGEKYYNDNVSKIDSSDPSLRDVAMMEFIVHFDFTTYHRGSRFIGRSGYLTLNTDHEIDISKEADEIQLAIAQFIHSKKPKWKIFMINIKSITKPETLTQ